MRTSQSAEYHIATCGSFPENLAQEKSSRGVTKPICSLSTTIKPVKLLHRIKSMMAKNSKAQIKI